MPLRRTAQSCARASCVTVRKTGGLSDKVKNAARNASGMKDAVDMVDASTAFGLFDPAQEKDSCGVGFIADIKGRKSHKIVEDALTILLNLEHRGAVGADPRAGDGAGILIQSPNKILARKAKALGISLPKPGEYGVGALFMPRDADRRELV